MFNFVKWFLNAARWRWGSRKLLLTLLSNRGVSWRPFFFHTDQCFKIIPAPLTHVLRLLPSANNFHSTQSTLTVFNFTLNLAHCVNTSEHWKGLWFCTSKPKWPWIAVVTGGSSSNSNVSVPLHSVTSSSPQVETCTRDNIISRYLFHVSELNAECMSAHVYLGIQCLSGDSEGIWTWIHFCSLWIISLF